VRGKMRVRKLLYVVGAVVILILGFKWHFFSPLRGKMWRGTPYILVTVYQSRNCRLYILDGQTSQLKFEGDALNHFAEQPGNGRAIGVAGVGSVFYKQVEINVQYDQVTIEGNILNHNPCSYIIDQSGRVKVGEIQLAE
jgi:hypothetical protein